MRVAVVGCGEIAQIMHIPYLVERTDVSLDSLVDPDNDRVSVLTDRYNVSHGYGDVETLLDARGDTLDAVVVCTPSHTHADVVTKTLARDINTLVEKPLAADPVDADRMVEAARDSDAVSMVAYMKRYDPAYERAQSEVTSLDTVDLVTAYDVDPDHGRIIREVYDVVDATLPEEFVAESRATRRERLERAIGTDDDGLVDAYDFQIEHVVHDVNALRGLFGRVESIDYVDVFADGRYATAALRYADGIRCVLETGDSDRKWFEEWIRMDSPDGCVTVEFSNPYIKNTPTELRTKHGVEELTEAVETPSYDEPFRRELEHFLACIDGDETVRTPFTEARDDVRLVADLFRRAVDVDDATPNRA